MPNIPSVLRRGAIGLAATTLGFATLAAAQAKASTTAAPTINTYSAWEGSTFVEPFGCPDTTTYGETITVPSGKTRFNNVKFPWVNLTPAGSMTVRGYIYAWNGTGATGSVIASTPAKTISYHDSAFHNVTFRFHGAPVTAGSQYVVFASIAQDYEACTDNYEVGWGWVITGDPYTGGCFVYQNNAGDESQWTSRPWDSFAFIDLALKAHLH